MDVEYMFMDYEERCEYHGYDPKNPISRALITPFGASTVTPDEEAKVTAFHKTGKKYSNI